MRPTQDPVIPLLIGGLVAVSIVAVLSIIAWVWAVRRPVPAAPIGSQLPDAYERPPLVYVAVGAQTGLGLDSDAQGGQSWVDIVRERLPEGTRLITSGRRGVTLAELNQVEIPAAAEARPDIVTLWNVVSDVVKSVPLSDYTSALHRALSFLCRGTTATIFLLNLPDISLLAEGASGERQALVRGGVVQWNRAISDAVARYGKRVRIVDLFPISAQILAVSDDEAHNDPDEHTRNVALADAVWAAIEKERVVQAR